MLGWEGVPPEQAVVPAYLAETYWWAYVHPHAVRVFERPWLVNAILWGNFARLRQAALETLGERLEGRTLQVACVYGDLTARLAGRVPEGASLDVVDVLPIQLKNLARKLKSNPRVALRLADSAALDAADATYDRVLLFFLLHEQPEDVRRQTLSEALRVLKPGGRLVVVDYHNPHPRHPLRFLMQPLLRRLEPFALDLWRHEVAHWLPAHVGDPVKTTYFGGLYQRLAITR
jgi:ubiquinone/menaquinone biosynthesis C-methylase UbiE